MGPSLAISDTLDTFDIQILRELRQNGWVLVFDDYRETTAGFLPGRIDADGDRLRIRLVAKRWEFAVP